MTYITLHKWLPETEEINTQKEALKFIRKRSVYKETLYGRIIKLLEKNPDGFSINEIAAILNQQSSTISARINEMSGGKDYKNKSKWEYGIIKEHEYRKSSISGITNKIWILCDNWQKIINLKD